MLLALLASALGGVLEDAVRERVAERLAIPAADVEVRVSGRLDGLPEGGTCTAQLPAVGAVEGRVPVTLACGSSRWTTRVEVVTWRALPVAAAAAEPGQPIVVTHARVSSERLRGEPLAEGEGPWRARVAIDAGAPLTASRVAPMPSATRGAEVTLEVASGALLVRAPGELLTDAFPGTEVSVLNRSTRAIVQGTYRDDGVVAVEVR